MKGRMSSATPKRWQEISPYLDEALAMNAEQRAIWMAELQQRDPALAADLEALLEEHRALEQEKFLEQSVIGSSGEAALAGQKAGAYTLIAPIGHGGMSTVWMGERSDGRFQGRVAIKFLSMALSDSAGQSRFVREGNILGRFTHPHIAHLMDAGVSPAAFFTPAGSTYGTRSRRTRTRREPLMPTYADGDIPERSPSQARNLKPFRALAVTSTCVSEGKNPSGDDGSKRKSAPFAGSEAAARR